MAIFLCLWQFSKGLFRISKHFEPILGKTFMLLGKFSLLSMVKELKDSSHLVTLHIRHTTARLSVADFSVIKTDIF